MDTTDNLIQGLVEHDGRAGRLPLGRLRQRCMETWLRFGPESLALRPDWICLPAIILVGAVPAIAVAIMLRKGAPVFPHAAVALGSLYPDFNPLRCKPRHRARKTWRNADG